MYVLDLFSGIGGFALGFVRQGFEIVSFCEQDKYCQEVLSQRFPDIHLHSDITKFAYGDAWINPDVITGGFPCQDISNAGSKQGIQGSRSSLWFEYLRLIGIFKPKFVVIENTLGLLKRGMNVIEQGLQEIGYDLEWQTVSASGYGAPHERQRVIILAYPTGFRQPEQGFLWKDPYCTAQGRQWQTTHAINALRRGTVPALCGEYDGLSEQLDRHKCKALGNALIPHISESVAIHLKEYLRNP